MANLSVLRVLSTSSPVFQLVTHGVLNLTQNLESNLISSSVVNEPSVRRCLFKLTKFIEKFETFKVPFFLP